MQKVTAANFKTHCLQYMDLAQSKHQEIVITKRGKPVAKLVPYQEEDPIVFGRMKGTIAINGDIISPIDVDWDVAS